MMPTEQALENYNLTITQEIHVNAPLNVTFDALIEELQNMVSSRGPMPMKLEAWPGGRWYRDLGDNNGHFWAVVQAINRPTLLEFHGPLMMSFPVVSNVQYRLTEAKGGTLITFHHLAFGHVPEDFRTGATAGWAGFFERLTKRLEANAKR